MNNEEKKDETTTSSLPIGNTHVMGSTVKLKTTKIIDYEIFY